jgi:hypothetical protein
MRLSSASRYFERDFVYDGYTGSFLFQAHITVPDAKASAGSAPRRRIMRVPPGTAAPARNVVQIYTEFWIVGNSNVEGFNSQQANLSFGLKKSTGLMTFLTPAQACLGTSGTDFHAQHLFYRDTSDPLTESERDTMYNVFCSPTEPIIKGAFLRQGGVLYRVSNFYPTVDGYTTAEADGLEADAYQSAQFTLNGTLDLVLDTKPTVTITTNVIQTDRPKFYRFRDLEESDRQPGDRTVFVAASALTVLPGDQFTMLGQDWQVITVQAELDALALHVRLV